MRKFIACLLLGALLGMIPRLLPAQQNQSAQRSNTEIEALKKRVSELEKQLQTVENADKMDLQAKLAEANAKLADAEFGKFERKLKDSNDKWLQGWSSWFVGVIGFLVVVIGGVGAIFWFWLRSRANQLIADEVEKNLTGFKEALKELGILKNQLGILEREYAAYILEGFINQLLGDEHRHPESIKVLREEVLLQILGDKRYDLAVRHKAGEVLAARRSSRLVSPTLELLNSVLDSNLDIDYFYIDYFYTEHRLGSFVNFLGYIYTPEAYQGLTRFLNRLLTEDPKHKDLFLMKTVFSLAWVSIKLDNRDSVSILRKAMSHFQHPGHKDLSALVEYFDRLNEPEGIKEILINHATSGMPDVKNKCLELLQKHDPEFVKEQRAKETTNNSEA